MKCPTCAQDLKVTPKGYWKSQDGRLTKFERLTVDHMQNIVRCQAVRIPNWCLQLVVRAIAENRRAEELHPNEPDTDYGLDVYDDDDIPFYP